MKKTVGSIILLAVVGSGSLLLFGLGDDQDSTPHANNNVGDRGSSKVAKLRVDKTVSALGNDMEDVDQSPLNIDASGGHANVYEKHSDVAQASEYEDSNLSSAAEDSEQLEPLPGAEIEYQLDIAESTFHDLKGKASSTIGDLAFDSKLLPSNEVKLSLVFEKANGEPVEFKAYFDLANYVMELDGGNAVLDQNDKELLRVSNAQLTSKLMDQFEGVGVPEHGFMLVRMLSYWSNSPEGYVHEKHASVGR